MARLLLIEDDAEQLWIRKLVLEREGHQVRTASTAAQALSEPFDADVVIMDLDADSNRLAAALPEAARIIVLSGKEAGGIVAERSSCQLRKPCATRALLTAIARLCGVFAIVCAALAA